MTLNLHARPSPSLRCDLLLVFGFLQHPSRGFLAESIVSVSSSLIEGFRALGGSRQVAGHDVYN